MSKGYVLATLKVEHADGYEAYRSRVRAVIESHGGRILVRGGKVEVKEGELLRDRVILIEFDSLDRARAYYESPDYQAILSGRQRNVDSMLILVEGADEALTGSRKV